MPRSVVGLVSVGVLLLGLAAYGLALGNRPFFTRGEAREAIVVDEMIDQSDLILPMEGAQEISNIATKPPMFHWLAVAASSLAGQPSEATIRSPSAVSAALLLAALFAFIGSAQGLVRAGVTVLVLASAIEWNRSATHARVDMVFTLGITLTSLALYSLIERWRADGRISVGWCTAAALSSAFSVLAKGPFGLLLPWGVAGAYFILSSGRPNIAVLRRLPWRAVLLTFAGAVVLSGSWYFIGFLEGGMEFIQVHLLDENLGRFMEVRGDKPEHAKPFFYSILYVLTGFFPFSLFLPLLCLWIWEKRAQLFSPENRLMLFSLLWFGSLFAAVTISTSKREVYLLPAYPALAHLTALLLVDLRREGALMTSFQRKFILLSLTSLAGLVLLIAATLPPIAWLGADRLIVGFISSEVQPIVTGIAEVFRANLESAAFLLCAGSMLATAAWSAKNGALLRASCQLSVAMIVFFGTINYFMLPAVAAASAPDKFVARMRTLVTQNAALYQYKHTFFPAMYYADRQIQLITSLESLPKGAEVFLLVRKDSLEEVRSRLENEDVLLQSENLAANGDGELVLIRYTA